jgi:hypothetical protein
MIGLRGCDGRLHGLGYSYEDLRGSMGSENCSPFDSECVQRNTDRAAAANAFWLSDPHSGHNTTEDWPLPGSVQTVVMTDPGRLDASGVPVFAPIVPAAGAVAPVPAAARPAADAAPGAPAVGGFVLPTVGGFDLSKIPVWGWAVAAGAAFFLFGGGRGR